MTVLVSASVLAACGEGLGSRPAANNDTPASKTKPKATAKPEPARPIIPAPVTPAEVEVVAAEPVAETEQAKPKSGVKVESCSPIGSPGQDGTAQYRLTLKVTGAPKGAKAAKLYITGGDGKTYPQGTGALTGDRLTLTAYIHSSVSGCDKCAKLVFFNAEGDAIEGGEIRFNLPVLEIKCK